jgi:hypothetical protein
MISSIVLWCLARSKLHNHIQLLKVFYITGQNAVAAATFVAQWGIGLGFCQPCCPEITKMLK